MPISNQWSLHYLQQPASESHARLRIPYVRCHCIFLNGSSYLIRPGTRIVPPCHLFDYNPTHPAGARVFDIAQEQGSTEAQFIHFKVRFTYMRSGYSAEGMLWSTVALVQMRPLVRQLAVLRLLRANPGGFRLLRALGLRDALAARRASRGWREALQLRPAAGCGDIAELARGQTVARNRSGGPGGGGRAGAWNLGPPCPPFAAAVMGGTECLDTSVGAPRERARRVRSGGCEKGSAAAP